MLRRRTPEGGSDSEVLRRIPGRAAGLARDSRRPLVKVSPLLSRKAREGEATAPGEASLADGTAQPSDTLPAASQVNNLQKGAVSSFAKATSPAALVRRVPQTAKPQSVLPHSARIASDPFLNPSESPSELDGQGLQPPPSCSLSLPAGNVSGYHLPIDPAPPSPKSVKVSDSEILRSHPFETSLAALRYESRFSGLHRLRQHSS